MSDSGHTCGYGCVCLPPISVLRNPEFDADVEWLDLSGLLVSCLSICDSDLYVLAKLISLVL